MVSLLERERDAANVSATFFEFGNFWSNSLEATSFESALKFGGMSRHNDGFASTDEIAGKTFSRFLVIYQDFVEW